jgi:predicted MFS family arabinose efflux permease
MIPMGPKLIGLFHLQPIQFSYLVASYTLAAGFFGFLGATIVDKFDRKIALLFCYLGFIAGNISCALALDFYSLLFSRILTGAFGGVLTSIIYASVADLIPYERRAAAIGKILLAFSITSLVGVPIGMYTANHIIWQAPFIILSFLSSSFFFLGIRYLPSLTGHINNAPSVTEQLKRVGKILADPNHLRALLVVVLLIIGQFSVISFLSTFSVTNLGFQLSDIKYIYMLAGLGYIIALPVFGKWADRFGKLRIFTIFIFLSLIPIYVITNLEHLPMLQVYILTTIFFLTIGGRMVPITTMVSGAAAPENRGSFLSIYAAVQQLSTGLAVYLSGSILIKTETGTLTNFHYVGFMAISSSLLCLFVARKLKARG